MKNVDRLAHHITKNGTDGVMIHSIPGNANWIIAYKIEPDKWLLTLGNPQGVVTYNLGTVSDAEHAYLWAHLVKIEFEDKTTQATLARDLKTVILNFKQSFVATYSKFTKRDHAQHPRKKTQKKAKKRSIHKPSE